MVFAFRIYVPISERLHFTAMIMFAWIAEYSGMRSAWKRSDIRSARQRKFGKRSTLDTRTWTQKRADKKAQIYGEGISKKENTERQRGLTNLSRKSRNMSLSDAASFNEIV